MKQRLWRSAAAVVLAGFAGLAHPQNTRPGPPVQPPKKTPGSPAQPAPSQPPEAPAFETKPAPEEGPYVVRSRPHDWTLSVRVRLRSETVADRDIQTGMPKGYRFEFNTLAMVFPLVFESGSSRLYDKQIVSELRIDDRPVPTTPALLSGYAGGTRLGRWDAGSTEAVTTARDIELRIEAPMRAWRTEYDEKSAMQVAWPKEGWPRDVASAFKSQMYLDVGWDKESGRVMAYDEQPLVEALARWVKEAGGRDIRGMTPAMAAKFLTARVWESVMPSQGDGLTATRNGEIAGIDLQGPGVTLSTGRGTPFDMTLLLTAVMRKAGLPARTVIGWDVGEGDGKFLSKNSKENRLRAWVEFALYDEAKNTVNWVPVDIVKLRKTSNRPASLDRAWKYFGTHDELDRMPPIAFQFHPPTDVIAYGNPGFWGWFVTPAPPARAEQAISFSATTTSKRLGDDQKRDEETDRKPEVKRGRN